MNTTPWFPGSVCPVHVGVYERRMTQVNNRMTFSYWTGSQWLVSPADCTVDWPLIYKGAEKPSNYQPWVDNGADFEWRGVTSQE
jgi:hypothetical protein